MYGDGSDGALNVASGTTNLSLNHKYQYTTVNVASGATLSTTDTTGSVLYILATTSVNIAGTINVSNKVNYGNNTWGITIDDEDYSSPGVKSGGDGGSAPGGTGGLGSTSGYAGGGAGGHVSQSGNGGNAGTSPVGGSGVSNKVRSSGGTTAVNGGDGGSSAGGGGGVYIERNSGGSGNNQASGGAGGGSHGANGANATSSTSSTVLNQSQGGGGGGAGGRAGRAGVHVVIKSPSITVSGSIITSGTAGQNGGNGGYGAVQNTSPSTDASLRAGAGGGGGGGNAGDIYLLGETFNTGSGTFTMSGGAGGSAGAGYTFGTPAENGVAGENGERLQQNPNGAEYIKIGSFTLNSGVSGTLDITGVGFRPGAVFVWMIPPTGTDAISIFMGASDGTSYWAMGGVSSTRTTQSRVSSTSRLIYRTSTDGSTVQQAATINSWLDDGFRLGIVGTTINAYQWGYMAFHEDVDVKVGTFTPGSASGSVTGVGFKPNGMITGWVNGSSTTMATAIGFVDSSLTQHGYSGGNSTGSGSYTHHTPGNAFAVASTGASGTGAVTAFNSDGFSYNFSVFGGFEQAYLAFGQQVRCKLGSFSTPTSGSPVSVTGVGFSPTGSMFFPYINSTTTYGYAWGLGGADKYLNQSVSAGGGYNGGSTIHNRYGSVTDAIARTGYGTADVPAYVGRITSFDADGFTATRQSGTGGETWLYFAFKRNYDEVTIQGKLSIKGDTNQEIYGDMRVNGSSSYEIEGVARIQKDIDRTIQGVLSVFGYNERTQTGVMRLSQSVLKTITGRASLAEKKYVTIPGRMRISRITVRTQLGQMFIKILTDRSQKGKLRILNRVLYGGIYKPDDITDGVLTEADVAEARAIKRVLDGRGEYEIVDSNDPGIYKQVQNKTGQFK